MSLTAPNDIYFKSRRALIIVSGLLALAVFVGIEPSESDSASTIFAFKLTSPEKIPAILGIVLLYAIWQLWAAWLIQTQEVRAFLVNKIDVAFSFVVALTAGLCYVGPFASRGLGSGLLQVLGVPQPPSWIISIISVALSLLALMYSNTQLFEKIKKKRRNLDSQVFEAAIRRNWKLIFNPINPNGWKSIVFLQDGQIGSGKNANETTWRVREGTLEILNDKGQIFSRFRLMGESFEHTNDEDTLSIRSQKIVLDDVVS